MHACTGACRMISHAGAHVILLTASNRAAQEARHAWETSEARRRSGIVVGGTAAGTDPCRLKDCWPPGLPGGEGAKDTLGLLAVLDDGLLGGAAKGLAGAANGVPPSSAPCMVGDLAEEGTGAASAVLDGVAGACGSDAGSSCCCWAAHGLLGEAPAFAGSTLLDRVALALPGGCASDSVLWITSGATLASS